MSACLAPLYVLARVDSAHLVEKRFYYKHDRQRVYAPYLRIVSGDGGDNLE